jgi:hypothetical protein
MLEIALTAGIPVVCGLLATLLLSTRAWQPGPARLSPRVRR